MKTPRECKHFVWSTRKCRITGKRCVLFTYSECQKFSYESKIKGLFSRVIEKIKEL